MPIQLRNYWTLNFFFIITSSFGVFFCIFCISVTNWELGVAQKIRFFTFVKVLKPPGTSYIQKNLSIDLSY